MMWPCHENIADQLALPLVSITKILILLLVFLAVQAGLCLHPIGIN